MTDQHAEVVTIVLGGKTRRLKFGSAAFRRAEKRGVSIPARSMLDPTLGIVPLLIWVGLLKDFPDLKEEDVLDWLDDADDEAEITKQVLAAFADSQKSAKKVAGELGNAAAPARKSRR
jgi:hypothetical protein